MSGRVKEFDNSITHRFVSALHSQTRNAQNAAQIRGKIWKKSSNDLDAFRFSEYKNSEPALDNAVEFLLRHWEIRTPIGPCHYGNGTLFMQVEYPFRGYNLFEYVYVLSFYNRAKEDRRFLEALEILKSKTEEGQIVVERVVPRLAKLSFCKKGAPSKAATKRYQEIIENLR